MTSTTVETQGLGFCATNENLGKVLEENSDNFGNNSLDIDKLLLFMSTVSENPLKLSQMKVKVANFEETGRGMQALYDLKEDDVLISVPEKFCITTAVLIDDPFIHYLLTDVINSREMDISWKELYILFLVYYRRYLVDRQSERQSNYQNDNTMADLANQIENPNWSDAKCNADWDERTKFYYYYIRSIPKVYTNPIVWPKAEYDLLPRTIRTMIDKEILDCEKSHRAINYMIEHISADHGENHCQNESGTPIGKYSGFKPLTKAEYYWGYLTLQTRCFYWGMPRSRTSAAILDKKFLNKSVVDNLALIPVVDMFNHNCTNGKSSAALNPDNRCFEIKTDNPNGFSKGNQVYIKYGDHGSEKLLWNYGFFNIGYNNLEDAVKVCLDDVMQALPKKFVNYGSAVRQSYLQEKYLNIGLMLAIDGPSWSLQRCCMVLLYDRSTDHQEADNKTFSQSTPEDDRLNEDEVYEELNDLVYENVVIPPKLITKTKILLRKIVQNKLDLYQASIKRIKSYCADFEPRKNYASLDFDFSNFNLWMTYELFKEFTRILDVCEDEGNFFE